MPRTADLMSNLKKIKQNVKVAKVKGLVSGNLTARHFGECLFTCLSSDSLVEPGGN